MGCPRRPAVLLLLLCAFATAATAADSSLPTVMANDNRTPAGLLKNGVLELHLEIRQGRWYPGETRARLRVGRARSKPRH